MERDTVVSGVNPHGQSCPFLKHVNILRVASKKLASDAQSVEQTMCLRRPRDEGFLTKLPRDFEQTSTPFWGICGAFGEDLSLPVEAIVRPEVLTPSKTTTFFARARQSATLWRPSSSLGSCIVWCIVAGVLPVVWLIRMMSCHRWVGSRAVKEKDFEEGSQGDYPALYLAINLPDGASPASDEGILPLHAGEVRSEELIGVSTSAADKEDAPTTTTSITARTYSKRSI
ncbi:hypothetical protein PLIIFM63780_002117 [Purpureocillium lilacinum]|nr:hypothetical protein PLIIFM63780_002117 [Purpureocillium lilacinum]